jgi:hypothetical protein
MKYCSNILRIVVILQVLTATSAHGAMMQFDTAAGAPTPQRIVNPAGTTVSTALTVHYEPEPTAQPPQPAQPPLTKPVPESQPVQLPPLFVRLPGVSDEFLQEISDDTKGLPQKLKLVLCKAGYRIAISRQLADAVPSSQNEQVRGYKSFVTWNQVFGMFDRLHRKVVMAELAETNPNGTLVPLTNKSERAGIVRHEFGHAVDDYLGYPSHSVVFDRAYRKGVQRLTAADKKQLSYYLQQGNAGKEEIFAETFAIFPGDACDPKSDQLLREKFPELVALTDQYLKG